MCGRYTLAVPWSTLVSILEVTPPTATGERSERWEPSFSIAPRTLAPVVQDRDVEGHRVREAVLARWGLHPAWAKESGPRPINARLETASSNGMFRGAFSSSRVLVPMSGYYEWTEEIENDRKVKNPHYIHSPGDEILAAAGLLAAREEEPGRWETTFTILTRTGEDAAGQVHDRMPALLSPAAWDRWLEPGKLDSAERDDLVDLLDVESRSEASRLVTHLVDRAVNNVRTLNRRDSSLIAPVIAAEPGDGSA